jgi:hypothetical protein
VERAPYLFGGRGARERIRFGEQSANQIVGEAFGDFCGGEGASGTEPADAPVEGAQNGSGGESGIAGHEFSSAGSGGDQITHALFVTIALYDETLLEAGRKGAGQQVGGGTFDFVEDAAQVGNDDQVQFFRGTGAQAAGFFESGKEAIESDVLAEEKDFVLALEVVVEVGGREVCGGGDVAHSGFGETGDPKLISGGAEDFQAAGEIAALNTAIRPAAGLEVRQFGLLGEHTTSTLKVTQSEGRLSTKYERMFRE